MEKSFILIVMFMATSVFGTYAEVNLQEKAIESRPDYFFEGDDFSVLGHIAINGDDILIAYNEHIWGEALRMTGRILLFKENELIGMYGVINNFPSILGNQLVFLADEVYGNVIDFSHGIPETILIDGELYKYEQIAQ
jgi:hypothetical protein